MSLTIEERFEEMKKIRDELLHFNQSPLFEYRVQNKYFPVVGEGSHTAQIMFIGEAPGKNEAETARPFCGKSGKVLDEMLESIKLNRSDVYITNILKCRPPENRGPLPEEIKAHTPWLMHQVNEIKPKVVCSLGNYATKFFLSEGDVEKMDSQPGITQVHGKVRMIKLNGMDIKLIPLFHPAAIIYNRKLIDEWNKDMEIVKKETGQKELF